MTPIELARQTLIQLSKSHQPPTPENFRRVYDEIAGIESVDQTTILNDTLQKLLNELGNDHAKYANSAGRISELIKMQDAPSLREELFTLITTGESNEDDVNWPALLSYLMKQLDLSHTGVTLARKKEGLSQLFNTTRSHPAHLHTKLHALITSWGEGVPGVELVSEVPAATRASVDTPPGGLSIATDRTISVGVQHNTPDDVATWRDLLVRTINLVVLPHFAENQGASDRVRRLLDQVQSARTKEELDELGDMLKSTLLRVELQLDTQRRLQHGLVQMLRLLVASMGELTVEDKWLHGQIAIIQEIISKPLDIDAVYSAENSLKELIYKQSALKPGLMEAKDTIKNMVSSFVDQLATITESTGTYHARMKEYQEQIKQTDDVGQISSILGYLVADVRQMNTDAHRSHESFRETKEKADAAEKQINELTMKLEYISEAAQQDFLTGALNRRGMDEAFEREFERADRHNTPLSLAMLDIDHFKKINDNMGHSTGDMALAHLAKVIKSILRSTDILARYGGEEFVILLPGTKQHDAVNVVVGVQRGLTKTFFMHNNERVLITFSAGVAERLTGETVDEVLPRADAALYEAKRAGRNRVVGAVHPQKLSST